MNQYNPCLAPVFAIGAAALLLLSMFSVYFLWIRFNAHAEKKATADRRSKSKVKERVFGLLYGPGFFIGRLYYTFEGMRRENAQAESDPKAKKGAL